ncbi:hypothetical protein L0337_09160 [candidate division KSB1 bacterium]|nr:hypothetical protein [candidate division KSB1 bacterium]
MTTLQKIEELIYKGFRETDERLAKHRQETDELFAKQRQETDALLVKHRQETDALWKKNWEETKERWQETDKRMERSFQVTKQEIDRLAKQFDGVADSLGRFAEQTVFPAIKRLFRERGIRLNLFYSNLEAHDLDGDNMETDVAGIGPKCAVVIEVKLRLRQTDVKEFLEKKLPRFFDFFPDFRRPILYGGVAGMSIDKDVDRFAYKKGLFVISQTGDNVQILNDKKFRPRSFAVTQDNRFPKRKTKRQRA